jgi:type I restriction enzyme S subunit
LFKASVFRRFVASLNTGSLIQHMFTSQLARFVLPLPPAAEQARIAAEVERHMTLADGIGTDIEHDLGRCARLRQAILRWAFEGKLVDQDPSDEPATALLERIRSQTLANRLERGQY